MTFYIICFLSGVVGILLGLLSGLAIFKQRNKDTEFVKCEYRKGKELITERNAVMDDEVSEAFVEKKQIKKEIKTKEKNMNKKEKQKLKHNHTTKTNSNVYANKLKRNASDDSMLEFNCAADGIDYDEYVKELQHKQEKSYNTLT